MLSARPGSLDERLLFILAMDHRQSLASTVYALDDQPSPADAAEIALGKEQVFAGAVVARDRLPAQGRPGVLVDERFGERVARVAREHDFALLMPIERSGQMFFQPEYGAVRSDEWLDHLRRFNPDYAKVLVHDTFMFPDRERRTQQEHLAIVTEQLRHASIPLVIELLIPTPGDDSRTDFEAIVRPALTAELLRDLHRHGVEPDVWKLEGYETAADAACVAAAAREGGHSNVTCIILGRGASEGRLDHWLEVAAPIDGFGGFAIGRSIWQRPLVDHLNGRIDLTTMSDDIARNFTHYAETYSGAACARFRRRGGSTRRLGEVRPAFPDHLNLRPVPAGRRRNGPLSGHGCSPRRGHCILCRWPARGTAHVRTYPEPAGGRRLARRSEARRARRVS